MEVRRIATGAVFAAALPLAVQAGSGESGKAPAQAPGYGMMGPGMMGPGSTGYGRRYGMGYGMGPMGTMGGMGRMGMMGPMGMMGHGMMGGWDPFAALGLNDKQRAEIRTIENGLRKKRWELMGRMLDERARLAELFAAESRDPKAIGAVYAKLFDLKRQMIEATIEARNREEAVLTEKQRRQFRQWRGRMRGHGMGYGMMWH